MNENYKYTHSDTPNIVYPGYIYHKGNKRYMSTICEYGSNKYSRKFHIANQLRYKPGYLFNGMMRYGFLSDYKVVPEVVFLPDYSKSIIFVDYYIPECNAIIELDGGYHNSDKDKIRDDYLSSLGLQVFRITEADWYDPSWLVDEAMKIESQLVRSTPVTIDYCIDGSQHWDKIKDDIRISKLNKLLNSMMQKRLNSLADHYPGVLEYLSTNQSTSLNLGYVSVAELQNIIGKINSCRLQDYQPTIDYFAKLNIIIKPVFLSW